MAQAPPQPQEVTAAVESVPSPPPLPDSLAGPKQVPPPPQTAPPTAPSSSAVGGGTGEQENLTSLLDEIAFLGQGGGQRVHSPTPTCRQQGDEGEGGGRGHSPQLLQLDSDDPAAAATTTVEGAERTRTPRSANGCDNAEAAKAPPPLLQRRVGGATVAVPALASRPMPRLVPLGLRGAPPT